MKVIKLQNKVFLYDVYWIITDDKNKLSEYMLENEIDIDIHEHYKWFTFHRGAISYLYLDDRSDYVLLHECVHIVQVMMWFKWITTWLENTEVLAYNVEWLYKNLLYEYYKHKKDDRHKNYSI